MLQIRFKNSNVFRVPYQTINSYTATDISSTVRLTSSSRRAISFTGNTQFYSYWNKYLKNDPVYQSISSLSADNIYRLYNRDENIIFVKPDTIQSFMSSSFTAARTITGQSYQYIQSNSATIGWFFPFQRSLILSQDIASSSSFSGDQIISYYMSQQRYFIRSLGPQHNRSNNSITAVTYNSGATAQQFIKDKLTYVTTISLIDNDSNVLAVRKLSRPIPKLGFLPTSFKIRFFN